MCTQSIVLFAPIFLNTLLSKSWQLDIVIGDLSKIHKLFGRLGRLLTGSQLKSGHRYWDGYLHFKFFEKGKSLKEKILDNRGIFVCWFIYWNLIIFNQTWTFGVLNKSQNNFGLYF